MESPKDLTRLAQLLEIERSWRSVDDPDELAHRIATVVAAMTGARKAVLELDTKGKPRPQLRISSVDGSTVAEFPLSINGKEQGLLRIEHDQPSISSADVEFLRIVASISGLALERAAKVSPNQLCAQAVSEAPASTHETVSAAPPEPHIEQSSSPHPVPTVSSKDGSAGLAAIAAHDLRKPLSVVLGYANILAEGGFGEIPKQAEAAVGVLLRRLSGLQSTVEALLDVHAESEHALHAVPVEAEMNTLFEHLARDVFPADSERIQWPGPESRFAFPVDPVLLTRLLQNLIDNALEHSEGADVRVECTRDQRYLRINIETDGGTFPVEQRDRIATGNGTRTAGANGIPESIGLRAVTVYVRAMRARIKVADSKDGQGSIVEISVPKARLSQPVVQPAQVSK